MLVQRIFIGFLFLMSTVFFVASFNLSMTVTGGLLGAGFFPRVISVLVMIMTLFYFITTFRNNDKQETSKPIDKQKVKVQLLFCLALLVTLALINLLGMLVSLGLFMIAILKFFEKMSWRRSIIFTIAMMVLIHVVFVRWLGLVMPTGLFY
ncbi:tripartite tricarboxylate transporter TctB family protein [Niallia sp. Krafla_26]|uniref:tripartite tricarboxylate transporter TctB family protein n=1 Tax=Niallia sp. Krafla_26 TaxID=3064703 RepID=UPI003D181CC7